MKNYKILADCKCQLEQEIIDTILENRGIQDVEHFLHPREEDMLPLDALNNIHKAYEIYKDACDSDKKIMILADCDVDGVTSGTIMTRYTREVQSACCECVINIGKAHGLKGQDLDRFDDTDLLIIVDSLDKNEECYKELKEEHNVNEIIVLDHHDIDGNIPYDKYITLVSSQDNYDNPGLSGAGVVWKFIAYCEMQDNGDLYYAEQYVDLAAIGILADVMPVGEMDYENRYIIDLGLKNLRNPGVKKIVGSYDFNSKSVLFSVAPLINAAIRLNKNESALKLLLANDNKEVLACKKVLEKCKEEQNELKESLLESVREQFAEQDENNVLYAVINTEYGVSGLIGNTVLPEYNKPVFILNDCGDKYMGSMRSIGYGNFEELCNNTGLAELHGHPEASGVEVSKGNFEEFIATVNALLEDLEQTTSIEVNIDAEITYTDATSLLAEKVAEINRISGKGFKPITFKVVGCHSYEVGDWKQGQHLVLSSNSHKFIEWNTKCDFDDMKDNALMNYEITCIAELEAGFLGRQYMIKFIMSDYSFG